MGHPIVGYSWEGYVIEQVLSFITWKWQSFFYRASAGNEIDLVLLPPENKKPIAIEIKHSLTPKFTRQFKIAMDDINAEKGIIIYPGTEIIPVEKNVSIVPFISIFDCL